MCAVVDSVIISRGNVLSPTRRQVITWNYNNQLSIKPPETHIGDIRIVIHNFDT